MAKRSKVKTQSKTIPQTAGRKKRVTLMLLSSALLFLMIYSYFSSFLIIMVALMPTMLIYFIDITPKRTLSKTTIWMNVAGCMIILMQLWISEHSFSNAISLLSDWINWMIIVSCTAVGFCLYLIVPPFVESYLEIAYHVRLKALYAEKEQLEEEWGNDVTVTSDMVGLGDVETEYEELKAIEQERLKRKARKERINEEASKSVAA